MLQYGRKNIEAQLKKRNSHEESEDEGYSEDPDSPEKSSVPPQEDHLSSADKTKNGYVPQQNGNSLISRDDKLMLVPEPPNNKNGDDSKLSDEENNRNSDTTVSENIKSLMPVFSLQTIQSTIKISRKSMEILICLIVSIT